jgi:electron transport complex protein RnfE
LSYSKIFKNGIIKENPVLVLLLGMCPTLATTTSLMNALGMGISAMLVLIGANVVVSILRKVIPEKIRIAAFVVIIAGFVTVIDMLIKAYLPALSESLGIFIPLIVVNCIILARAEAFASKNGVIASALDGFSVGIGFTLALCLIAFVRELLGAGSILGINVLGDSLPAGMLLMPPGGFLVLGVILGALNYYNQNKKPGQDKEKKRSVRKIDKDKLKYKLEGGV